MPNIKIMKISNSLEIVNYFPDKNIDTALLKSYSYFKSHFWETFFQNLKNKPCDDILMIAKSNS